MNADEQLDIARTEVRRAEEALEHLGVTNEEDPTGESGEQIPVRAPFAGVVLERLVTDRHRRHARHRAVRRERSLHRCGRSPKWTRPRSHASRANRPVHVRVSAYPDEAFYGRVTFVGDTVNPKTRRMVVRCELPNPDGRLKPEMYATVTLDTGAPHRAVVVPAAAVQETEGHAVVFVEEAPGRFRPSEVTTGAEEQGLVEIRAGLRAGERVATTGEFLLKSALLDSGAPEGD